MKIKEVCLTNFRCFDDLKIPFHPDVTLIVGENGAGKTAILESVAVALATFLYSFDGVSAVGIKKSDARSCFFEMGDGVDVQPQFPIHISASADVDETEIKWKRSLNGVNGKTTIVDAKEMQSISQRYSAEMVAGNAEIILPLVAYYGTGRLWDYHRMKRDDGLTPSNRSYGYVDSLGGTANVKLMMAWFKKKTFAESQSGTIKSELVAVRTSMERCISLISGLRDPKVELDSDTGELMVSYINNNGCAQKQPISQLSDGYKGTISLIADIAYRMATLNPAMGSDVLIKTSGVVLIDEIDLHLHPAWQQRIIGDLRAIFPKIQFIITSHAPAVIHSVKSHNLLILTDYKIKTLFQEVYGKDVNTVLQEIMGVTERPEEVAKLFVQFYDTLKEGQFDLAEGLLDEIESIRTAGDSELNGCRMKLRLERLRGGVV